MIVDRSVRGRRLCVIEVWDSGPGLDPAVAGEPAVFPSRLSLAKQTALAWDCSWLGRRPRLMAGDNGLAARNGERTCFRVELPAVEGRSRRRTMPRPPLIR